MKLTDIMTKRIITKDMKTPVWEVARIMDEYDIGFVPITNANKIVGVITDRDIATKCIKENYNNSKSIDEFMTKKIITINSSELVSIALNTMAKNKVKRLLVEEENQIIGIISLSDIFMHYDLMSDLLPTLQSIWHIERNYEEKNVPIQTFEL